MKFFFNFVNGALIYFVGGWSLLAPDWQAWVLMLSFVIYGAVIEVEAEETAKAKLRSKISPILDRMEKKLGDYRS